MEVVEHFLEKNDFHSFPEMPISEGNVFFLKSKSHLQNRQKMSQKSFQENHFWVASKSFSCVKNHFWTGRKWFFAPVNHFFCAKNSQKSFFVAVNHLKKIISKWKWFPKKSFPNGNHLRTTWHFWNAHGRKWLVSGIGNHFRRNGMLLDFSKISFWTSARMRFMLQVCLK